MNENEKGLQIVDATVRIIIEIIKLNRLVGYEKFSISEYLREGSEFIKEYGIGKAPINDMQLMVLEDMHKRLMDIDNG